MTLRHVMPQYKQAAVTHAVGLGPRLVDLLLKFVDVVLDVAADSTQFGGAARQRRRQIGDVTRVRQRIGNCN